MLHTYLQILYPIVIIIIYGNALTPPQRLSTHSTFHPSFSLAAEDGRAGVLVGGWDGPVDVDLDTGVVVPVSTRERHQVLA